MWDEGFFVVYGAINLKNPAWLKGLNPFGSGMFFILEVLSERQQLKCLNPFGSGTFFIRNII